MVNQKFVEKIYKFHNFNVEVECSVNNPYSDDGKIFVIFFDDLDLVEWGSYMNLPYSSCESVYVHKLTEDRSKSFPFQHRDNRQRYCDYLKEVISRVYTHFVNEMNVSKDEFRYVWDLFVNDINKVIKEKLIKSVFKDKSCKPVDINLLLLPNYIKIYDVFLCNLYTSKEEYRQHKRLVLTTSVRSNNFTLFNQLYDFKTIELSFDS
jgi:hypothetical protein